MNEATLQPDNRGARHGSRRRWVIAGLLTVGALVAANLIGMTSASARPATQTMVGRAFNITVATSTLGKSTPIVGPILDTGVISTTTPETFSPPCSVLTGLIAAQALCNQVTATADPAGVTATSSLAGAQIGTPGIPAIVLGAVTVTSTTTCAGSVGTTTIAYLSVGGHVVINSPTLVAPNTQISVAGIKLALNQQVPNLAPAIGLRVNALHVQVGNAVSSIYVTVGHAESLIRRCPTTTG